MTISVPDIDSYDPDAMPSNAELEKHSRKVAVSERSDPSRYECGGAGLYYYNARGTEGNHIPLIRTEADFRWTTLAVLDGI